MSLAPFLGSDVTNRKWGMRKDKGEVYTQRVWWWHPYLPTHFQHIETMQLKCAQLRGL